MDWNALALVAAGGLIGIAGSYFNNWFQSREQDKNREEQRRDAKIQSEEKLIERDIVRIMESIERASRAFMEYDSSIFLIRIYNQGEGRSLFSEAEFKEKLKTIYNKLPVLLSEGLQSKIPMEILAHSFGDQNIVSRYKEYIGANNAFLESMNEALLQAEAGNWEMDIGESRTNFDEKAGKFHQALRDKLISIRDT